MSVKGIFQNLLNWERMLFAVPLVALVVVPLFFIPASALDLSYSKFLIITLLALVLSALSVGRAVLLRTVTFSSHPIFLTAAFLLIVAAVSASFSESVFVSFFGSGTETGTAMMMFVFFAIFTVISLAPFQRSALLASLSIFALVFAVIVLFVILKFVFGPDFLSLGLFRGVFSNPLGTWFDFGILSGAAALLSLVSLELGRFSRKVKVLLHLLLLLSLLSLVLVDFSVFLRPGGKLAISELWLALALFALIVGLYRFWSSRGAMVKTGIPYRLLLVFVFSAILVFTGQRVTGGIMKARGYIQPVEVRPSLTSTFRVGKGILRQDPLLGSGPNTFVSAWGKWKPAAVNETIFWGVDFRQGRGFVLTSAMSMGFSGLVAWLLLAAAYLYAGWTILRRPLPQEFLQFASVSTFLLSLFFWLFAILYVPSLSIIALAVIFSGFFFSTLVSGERGDVREMKLALASPAAAGLAAGKVLLLLAAFIGAYFGVARMAAEASFAKAGAALSNVDQALKHLRRAAAFSGSDRYFRSLADVYLAKAGIFYSQNRDKLGQPEVERNLVALFENAIAAARRSVSANPANYENYLALGRVYELLVPYGIAGADREALANYRRAENLAPRNPGVYLAAGRFLAATGNGRSAKEQVEKSLKEKSNFTEAVFLLSQIEVTEGNAKKAIAAAEKAADFSPLNPVVHFQLGFLKYSGRDLKGAAESLERAVALNQSYSNARYYLGLSYDRLGRRKEALEQFKRIAELNRDSAEVKQIIDNLEEGRGALSGLSGVVEADKRLEPPFRE
ncbi:MAG: hypothetical protein HYT43_00235 [Candidatus Taylorbacteria bacterium]|nr:hypothetical protein [Candidatus Taylorbacteria bacterium]